MKKIMIFAVLVLSLGLTGPMVDAYPIEYHFTSDETEFFTIVTGCTGEACDALMDRPYSKIYDSSVGNARSNTITIDGVSGDDTHVEYHYAEGYLPLLYVVDTTDATENGPHSFDLDFIKKSECSATIRDIDMDSDIEKGEDVDIDVEVESAFSRGDVPEGVPIPDELRNYFSSNVEVEIVIRNQDGELVFSDAKSKEIFMDDRSEISFEWEDAEEGDFEAEIVSRVIDSACSSSDEESEPLTFEVGNGFSGSVTSVSESTEPTSMFADVITKNLNPGNSGRVEVTVHNGESQDTVFDISIATPEGFTSTDRTLKLESGETKKISMYFQVHEVEAGEYLMEAEVEYGSGKLIDILRIDVSEKATETTTSESSEEDSIEENRQGGGPTGYFVAGGSILAGIITLLLLLAVLFWAERRKHYSQEPSKPLLEQRSPNPGNAHYTSIFGEDAY